MSALPVSSPLKNPPPETPVRLARAHLSCEVIRSLHEVASLREEWDRAVIAAGGGIEQTFDWCKAWWECYGGRREPRVYLFRDGNELVGVAPMCIDRVQLGPVNLRIAKIMGSDCTQSTCDLPIRATWAETALDELVQRLMCDERCDAVHFGPIRAGSERMKAMREVHRRRGDLVWLHHDRVITQHGEIPLPDTFEGYLESLSRNQRSNVRKDTRRLADDFDVNVEIVADPGELTGELDAFVRMHSDQWRAAGRLGHFGDWPDAERLHRRLVDLMRDTGRVRLLRLRADDRIVARQYAYILGDTCHCRLAARSADDRWRTCGLGRVSLVKLIEHVIAEGVSTLDVGTGHYDYKQRLGAVERDVHSILLTAHRETARSRARIFTTIADLIDRFYYRLWYCRIAPRVPGPRRPLRTIWIRSRV